jgi:hypothetical protein
MTITMTNAALGAASLAFLAVTVNPAVAGAQDGAVNKFSSPSGNVRCVITATAGSPSSVACQLENITYTVPVGTAHDDNGAACDRDYGSGRDVRLVQGQPGYVRCSYAALDGGVGPWPTLAYGQSQTLGGIACESSPTAVTCTDTGSGHFIRISRDLYELG